MKRMHKRVRIMLLLLLAVILGTLVAYRQAVYIVFCNLTVPTYQLDNTRDWGGGRTYLEVSYSDVSPSDYLNLYVPEAEDAPPLFVLIHGGGFVSGDAETRQVQWMYRYFRDRGYACATVNYRLAQEAAFPAAVEDCKAAIRYLRAHAAEYGYNAERIAVFGESAGGYLAVMCAVTNDQEFNDLNFVGQDETGDVSARVDVLVDYYGYIEELSLENDLKKMKVPKVVYQIANNWMNGALQDYESMLSFWLRKNVSEMSMEERSVFDPYTYIEENLGADNDLRVWIVHGDCDLTIPSMQSERLYNRLIELLGEDHVSYRLIPNMGHASDPLYSDDELEQLEGFFRNY